MPQQWGRNGRDTDMWQVVFMGDKDNDAWALVDDDGNERQPSFWYYSRREADSVAVSLEREG
jgi:hypothetical protein